MIASLTIDARGLSCPQPALRTEQALRRQAGGTIQVLVDSTTSRDNVVRTAQRAGWQAAVESDPQGGYRVTLTKS